MRVQEIELEGEERIIAAPRVAEVAVLLVEAGIVVVLLGLLRVPDDAAGLVEAGEAVLDGLERRCDLLGRLRDALGVVLDPRDRLGRLPRRLLDLRDVLLDYSQRLLQPGD